MSFLSIPIGSPFYILKTSPELVLETGIVKNKTERPTQQQGFGIPQQFNIGQQPPRTIPPVVITVDINGSDVTVPEVPGDVEVASSLDGTIYTGNKEELAHSIEGIIQASKTAIDQSQIRKHEKRIQDGNKLLEQVNPVYAEQQEQARMINKLQNDYRGLSSDLSEIKTMLSQALGNSLKPV